MRLGVQDHKVIRAFVERSPMKGQKLSTDGQRLDGHWLGGSRIADWSHEGTIVFHDKGSRAAESVQKQIRYHASPMQLSEQPRGRARRDPRRRTRTRTEYESSLRWNIKDAKEALHNAVDMSDWRGVEKYVGQPKALERKLYELEAGRPAGPSRARRQSETSGEAGARWERQRAYRRAGRRGLP